MSYKIQTYDKDNLFNILYIVTAISYHSTSPYIIIPPSKYLSYKILSKMFLLLENLKIGRTQRNDDHKIRNIIITLHTTGLLHRLSVLRYLIDVNDCVDFNSSGDKGFPLKSSSISCNVLSLVSGSNSIATTRQ